MSMFTSTRDEIKKLGHATFNDGLHTFIDLSHLDEKKKHTINVKLNTQDNVAISFAEQEVVFQYQGNSKHQVIGFFDNGTDKRFNNASSYTLQYGLEGNKNHDYKESSFSIDFSDLKSPEMRTLSILLPNRDYFTVCTIPFHGGKSGTLDFKYHGNVNQQVIGDNEEQIIKNAAFYTLDYKANV